MLLALRKFEEDDDADAWLAAVWITGVDLDKEGSVVARFGAVGVLVALFSVLVVVVVVEDNAVGVAMDELVVVVVVADGCVKEDDRPLFACKSRLARVTELSRAAAEGMVELLNVQEAAVGVEETWGRLFCRVMGMAPRAALKGMRLLLVAWWLAVVRLLPVLLLRAMGGGSAISMELLFVVLIVRWGLALVASWRTGGEDD